MVRSNDARLVKCQVSRGSVEIRSMIAELDQLVSHQWQRPLEIQEMQIEGIDSLSGDRPRSRP